MSISTWATGCVNSTPHPHALSTKHFSGACLFMAQGDCTVSPLHLRLVNIFVCQRFVHSLADTATATCSTTRGTTTFATTTSSTRSSKSTSCTLHTANRRLVCLSENSIHAAKLQAQHDIRSSHSGTNPSDHYITENEFLFTGHFSWQCTDGFPVSESKLKGTQQRLASPLSKQERDASDARGRVYNFGTEDTGTHHTPQPGENWKMSTVEVT